jgi:hypothetical protein
LPVGQRKRLLPMPGPLSFGQAAGDHDEREPHLRQ